MGEPVKKAAKQFDEMLTEMHWLQHLDERQGFDGEVSALFAGTISSGSEGPAGFAMDEDALFAGLDRLDKARAAAAAEHTARGCGDFKAIVRGGASQVVASGEAVHAMQAVCVPADRGLAYDWAKRRGLRVSFKATFHPHGVPEAKAMTRSWCHRMQHFFNLEVESGLGPELVYSRDVVDAYEEPVELTALERDGRVPEWQARIAAIRRIPFRG